MRNYRPGMTSAVTILLIVDVLLAGTLGVLSYTRLSSPVASSPDTHQATTSAPETKAVELPAPDPFYDCVYAAEGASMPSSAEPPICIINGKTYIKPSEFPGNAIFNYDRLPESSKATVVEVAKRNYRCGGPLVATTEVEIAQDNFVGLVMSCDNAWSKYLGLDNGVWTDLIGNSYEGLPCEIADKYHVRKRSFLTLSFEQGHTIADLDTNCWEAETYDNIPLPD